MVFSGFFLYLFMEKSEELKEIESLVELLNVLLDATIARGFDKVDLPIVLLKSAVDIMLKLTTKIEELESELVKSNEARESANEVAADYHQKWSKGVFTQNDLKTEIRELKQKLDTAVFFVPEGHSVNVTGNVDITCDLNNPWRGMDEEPREDDEAFESSETVELLTVGGEIVYGWFYLWGKENQSNISIMKGKNSSEAVEINCAKSRFQKWRYIK